MKTAEFCPRCYHPLDTINEADDDGRLCSVCSWFCDKIEVCKTPPVPTTLELAFAQLLILYRDVCRIELMAEQFTENQPDYSKKLVVVRARVQQARHSILHLFRMTENREIGLEDNNNETPA